MPLQLQPIEPSSSSSSAEPELELHLLPPEFVAEMWDVAFPFVRAAIPRVCGRMTAGDVLIGCLQGRMGLWLIGPRGGPVQGIGVTEVLTFPQKKVLFVMIYSGEREHAMPLWPKVETHAREMGCVEVQIAGPRAWKRIFPEYEEQYTVFTRKVI